MLRSKTGRVAAARIRWLISQVAVDPSELPREIFASIGRCVLRDVGNTAVGMRLGVALLPYGALAHIIALVAPFLPDYVENDKKRGQV